MRALERATLCVRHHAHTAAPEAQAERVRLDLDVRRTFETCSMAARPSVCPPLHPPHPHPIVRALPTSTAQHIHAHTPPPPPRTARRDSSTLHRSTPVPPLAARRRRGRSIAGALDGLLALGGQGLPELVGLLYHLRAGARGEKRVSGGERASGGRAGGRAARVAADRGEGPAGESSGSGDASHQAGGAGRTLRV